MINPFQVFSIKEYTVNPVIKALIMNNLIVWSGANLIIPILPLFIAERLDGKSIEIVAIGSAIYLFSRALIELPIGKIIDTIEGSCDELWIRVAGTIISGLILISYPFISQVWHIYLLQFIHGMARGIAAPAWLSLFSKYLDENREAVTWGIQDSSLNIGMALSAALGGFIAQEFGFPPLFYIAGLMTLIGALLPLIAADKIKQGSTAKTNIVN